MTMDFRIACAACVAACLTLAASDALADDEPPTGGIKITPTSGWTATEVGEPGSNAWHIHIMDPTTDPYITYEIR